jgi:N-acetylglucosaminyldiphosphoundecaprenol N-acetyl-beta-D-mannosaminyltransferase
MQHLTEAEAPAILAGVPVCAIESGFGRRRVNILGVGVDAVEMERALEMIQAHLATGRAGFVCALGVHGILESLKNPEVALAYAGSILNVPDGAPTVWLGRLQGFRQMDHVTGPALMLEIFKRPAFASCSHFFYGGKPGVADQLASNMLQRFPSTRIAGTYTPPFRDLTLEEEKELISYINALQPDIVWVGIGTPRQDLWMRRMLPRLETRLMFGVGAAFDFHTGRIRECPDWIKRAGFHWLHRLLQDPGRLWRRNLNNTAFLWHIALQLTGLRDYALHPVSMAGSPAGHTVAQTCSDDRPAGEARWLRQS